ncbi:biotin transporter BioY [Psychromarinibacter sp. C21-152]|uniref:Biotin transporter n=1 Tax=Psychromarinibacter sediminicola TaxID=3033385 RepID=A0AAE3T7B9_9RHOB|nr:biotin transporter BioY [Psychromarinibacter sediminicola]MDF0600157.1 biotin transporter BioY [Psychromarinibacter sediminicola]
MTLTQAALGQRNLLTNAALVLGGSAFIALAAQVSVPMWPVPMTLQSLAILIVGLTFGARLGAATLLAYLAEGLAGLPVFANGGAGVAYFFGPTCGFLLGFVLTAWIAGFAADRGLTRGVVSTALVALVAGAAMYIPGVAWPMGVAALFGVEGGWVGTTAAALWAGWVSPFLLGDAVKAVIAALVVSGGWAALKARRG